MPESEPSLQYFEKSGTDPGLRISSALPDAGGSRANSTTDPGMTMTEHLGELRMRIIASVVTFVVMLGLAFVFSLDLIRLFQAMAPRSVTFIQLSPGEVLVASCKLSVYTGAALASPVILYNVLRFVLPGLRPQERGIVLWSVAGGSLLFVLGIAFAYFWVVPPALDFLFNYGHTVAASQQSIENYISFCAMLLLITGIMFELPMVLFLLSFTGLVSSQKLISEWRWATILIFATAAIVTPSQDPLSMAAVGLAMVALYGLSIIPIKLCGR